MDFGLIETSYVQVLLPLPESFKASLKRPEDGCGKVCVCVYVFVFMCPQEEPQWTNNRQREINREKEGEALKM